MASTLERHRVNQLTFLAGVAHDLRSPLSALRTSAELLRRGDSLPPGQRDRVAGVVQRQTDLLERMVGDLLDAARIEAGELELRLEDCDLSRIAEEVVELHRASAATDQAATHQIVLRGADEPVMIHADPTRLAQVLTNLVGNAVKYSPDGGVITVTIATDEERVTVSVSDEGMGISEQDAGRIFEPFRRVGSGRHTLPGAGLGLSVVRRIVESHAGVVRVQSRIGAGSTFEVALPAERGAYRAPARVSDRLH
jgi:signal transduction histidine kinase